VYVINERRPYRSRENNIKIEFKITRGSVNWSFLVENRPVVGSLNMVNSCVEFSVRQEARPSHKLLYFLDDILPRIYLLENLI
jgi:hypothetical protein